MKFYYDFHIHSDLSPCGNKEMTPNNIVNMSLIKGLNFISLADHNTAKNLPAITEVGERVGVKIIPGIEVTTKEEVHVLCYFRDLKDAVTFGDLIYDSLPPIKNIPEIFGQQNIYNSKDEIIGTLEKLLINACPYSIEDIFDMVKDYQGVMVPAHINKLSNSILSILGFMPENLKIGLVEVYQKLPVDKNIFKNYKVLYNSDAHQLTDISERVNFLDVNSMDEVYDFLFEES